MKLKHFVSVAVALASFSVPASHVSAHEHSEVAESAHEALESFQQWRYSGLHTDYISFVLNRIEVASLVADELDEPVERFLAAWATTEPAATVALLAALAQIGNHWVFGSDNPDVGLDCSGLTQYAWGVAGVPIPGSSRLQIKHLEKSEEVLAAGHLVAWPGHVMMSLGVGTYVVHSGGRRTGVELSSFHRSSYQVLRPQSTHDRHLQTIRFRTLELPQATQTV